MVICSCCETEFEPDACPACEAALFEEKTDEVREDLRISEARLQEIDDALAGLLQFLGFPTNPTRVNIPEVQRLVDAVRF